MAVRRGVVAYQYQLHSGFGARTRQQFQVEPEYLREKCTVRGTMVVWKDKRECFGAEMIARGRLPRRISLGQNFLESPPSPFQARSCGPQCVFNKE